ncbi:MAG: hypothetical protein ACRCSQ_07620 [Bacteroidales bacterium]
MEHSVSKTSDNTKKQVNNILSEYHTLDSESKDIVLSELINQINPSTSLILSMPRSQAKLTIKLSDLGGFVYQDRTIYIKDKQGNTTHILKKPFTLLTDEIHNGYMKHYFFIRKSYIIPYSLFTAVQYSDLTSVQIKNIFQTIGINYSPNAEEDLRKGLVSYLKREIIKNINH